jgi:uncharacterized protein (TIGR02145 family)
MKNLFRISGVILIISVVFSAGCKKSDQDQLPEIFTTRVRMVMPNSAIIDGKLTSTGGSRLSEQGVCWGTGHLPVITDNKIMLPFQDICPYTLKITGLSQQTGYYVRAYATNSTGTAYGEEVPFTTPADHLPGETGTVADAEGNVYQTIGIGSQIWMAENLRATRYSNGDLIGTTIPATLLIREETTRKYQWAYDGNENNVATYGRLYTWYAVTDTRNVCPTGWHVPTDAEWDTLITYLGDEKDAGGKLKEAGTAYWLSPNNGATNYFGFTALPGGSRNLYEEFTNIGSEGSWWLGSETFGSIATCWYIYYNGSLVFGTDDAKWSGHSVRCLQD